MVFRVVACVAVGVVAVSAGRYIYTLIVNSNAGVIDVEHVEEEEEPLEARYVPYFYPYLYRPSSSVSVQTEALPLVTRDTGTQTDHVRFFSRILPPHRVSVFDTELVPPENRISRRRRTWNLMYDNWGHLVDVTFYDRGESTHHERAAQTDRKFFLMSRLTGFWETLFRAWVDPIICTWC